jgi:hypothetical protein
MLEDFDKTFFLAFLQCFMGQFLDLVGDLLEILVSLKLRT